MSNNGDAMSVRDFDLDAWIDDVDRPSVVVELYQHEAEFLRRVEEIEAQIPAAEKAGAERGIDQPSAEALYAQLDELKRERSQKALKVRVRQLTDGDTIRAAMAAKRAGVRGEGEILLWGLAAATVHPDYDGPLSADDVPPHFTGPQLIRLAKRDRSGAHMVKQLMDAANDLMKGGDVPVPS